MMKNNNQIKYSEYLGLYLNQFIQMPDESCELTECKWIEESGKEKKAFAKV